MRRRTVHISWWVWVALLVGGLAAVAAGLGWFLVVSVAILWLAVTLFNRAAEPDDEQDGDDTQHPQSRHLLAQPRRRLDAALRHTSTPGLCLLWEQTGQELRRTYLPSTVCSYAELREAILDELTARHPDGVRRWLDDQPDGRELSSYLQHHP